MSRQSRIPPTQWGEIARKAGLVEPDFRHSHVCNATLEKRDCTFKWERHDTTNNNGECDCIPQLDMSNVLSKDHPIIFIVHRGSC